MKVDLENPGWIAANEAGRIAEGQRSLLARDSGLGDRVAIFLVAPAWCALEGWIAAGLVGGALYLLGAPEATMMAVGGSVGGLVLLRALWRDWLGELVRMQRIRRDVRDGAVEKSRGSIGWHGRGIDRGYCADVDGRLLKFFTWPAGPVFSADLNNPVPGLYDVFHLRRSGWVISVQRVEEMEEQDLKRHLLDVLSANLPFPLESLAANRTGRLSRKQRPRLFRMAALRVAGAVVASGFALGALRTYGWDAAVIVFAAFPGGLAIYFFHRALRIVREALNGSVETVSGIASGKRTRGRHNQSATFWIVVGDTKFEVGPFTYRAVVPGLAYRAYYLPASRVIVSMEPL